MIRTYLDSWLGQAKPLLAYRNTLICVIVVCLASFVGYYHKPYVWIHASLDTYPTRIPARQVYQGLIFLAIPLLSLAFMKPANRCGLNLGHWRRWLVDIAIAYGVIVVLILLFCRNETFLKTYPLYKPASQSWSTFWWYAAIHGVYMFGWEFLFRGYMLFGTEKELGKPLAVIVQCLPFALLHMGKPELESIGSILAGLYLGLLALRANSMLPCAILHFAAAFTMDLLATSVRMGHTG